MNANSDASFNHQFALLFRVHPVLDPDPEIEERESEEETHGSADGSQDVEKVHEDVLLHDGLLDPLEVDVQPCCESGKTHVVVFPPGDLKEDFLIGHE